MSILRRSMELGLGALLLTKEAAEELLDELGEGSEPERKSRVDDLVAKGQQLRDELLESIRHEVDAAIDRAGLVKRSDYEALLARVTALEQRLGGPGFETAADL